MEMLYSSDVLYVIFPSLLCAGWKFSAIMHCLQVPCRFPQVLLTTQQDGPAPTGSGRYRWYQSVPGSKPGAWGERQTCPMAWHEHLHHPAYVENRALERQ